MKPFHHIIFIIAIVALGGQIRAVPLNPSLDEEGKQVTIEKTEETESNKTQITSSPEIDTVKDLETSNSNPEPSYVLPEHHTVTNDNGQFDPTLYAGYLTPEAFQQYLAQFAGALGPYAYPGYGPAPVYPAPYAVQTGYDGILVPSTSISASGSVSNTAGNVLTAFTNTIPSLMESTIFRVIASILGVILMTFFGGAVTTAICNLTSICDISFKAVEYLRGDGAGDMGRMVTEQITPERVRRATEFVHNAIRKYKEMQRTMTEGSFTADKIF